jgi:hypothetical protein
MTPSRGLSPRRSLRLAGWELKTRRKFPSSRSKSWAPIGRVKLRAAERVSHPGVGSDGQVFPRPYHTCRRGFDRDFRLCSFPIVDQGTRRRDHGHQHLDAVDLTHGRPRLVCARAARQGGREINFDQRASSHWMQSYVFGQTGKVMRFNGVQSWFCPNGR